MKVLLVLAVLIAVTIAAGWLSVRFTDDGANISIDAKKARSDTSRALESFGEAIKDPIEANRETEVLPPR